MKICLWHVWIRDFTNHVFLLFCSWSHAYTFEDTPGCHIPPTLACGLRATHHWTEPWNSATVESGPCCSITVLHMTLVLSSSVWNAKNWQMTNKKLDFWQKTDICSRPTCHVGGLNHNHISSLELYTRTDKISQLCASSIWRHRTT